MHIPISDRAMLFDLDDTLVRTGDIVLQSMSRWCALHQLDLEIVLSHSSGMRIEDTVAKVAPHLDAKIESRRIEDIESEYLEDLEPVAGALELLTKFHPDSWGIVTSSPMALALKKISITRMATPKTLVTSESVANGKPSPDCYLLGADRMGFEPKKCLVFEDSDAGIVAGLSAGCEVIAVGKEFTPDRQLLAAVPDLGHINVEQGRLVIRF